MKKFLMALLIIGLTACGSNPNRVAAVKVGDELYKPDAAAAQALDTGSSDKVICKKRIVTGSHRKQKICTTAAQMELDKQRSQEMIDRNRSLLEREAAAAKGGD